MSFLAFRVQPAMFVLYAGIMVGIVPRENVLAEALFWGGLLATFMFVVWYAGFALSAGDDVGWVALLGYIVGGFAVWLLHERGFHPAVVALLPWGGALWCPVVHVVGVGVFRGYRRVRDLLALKAASGAGAGAERSRRDGRS